MKKLALLITMCVLGVAACSHQRVPTDAQLAKLLRSDQAGPNDTNAAFDQGAISCLRAWSGDPNLLRGLPMRVAGEDGKKTCQTVLDTRLANAAHNPDHFSFAEVTTPAVVHRVVAMQEARRLVQMANPDTQQIPAALLKDRGHAPATSPGTTFAPLDPTINLGVAGTQLQEAQSLCEQARQAAATPDAKENLKRYAAFCMVNLKRLQSTLEIAGKNNRSPAELEKIAASANNMATVARNLLAAGKK